MYSSLKPDAIPKVYCTVNQPITKHNLLAPRDMQFIYLIFFSLSR